MKLTKFAALGLLLLCAIPATQAVTVSYTFGDKFTTFMSTSGDPLLNGHLHAGYYPANPVGLNTEDLRDTFQTWGTFAQDSGGRPRASNSLKWRDSAANDPGGACSSDIADVDVTCLADPCAAYEAVDGE